MFEQDSNVRSAMLQSPIVYSEIPSSVIPPAYLGEFGRVDESRKLRTWLGGAGWVAVEIALATTFLWLIAGMPGV